MNQEENRQRPRTRTRTVKKFNPVQRQYNQRKKKIAFYTLGCKLNFAETSAIARLFDSQYFERVNYRTKADIYVINTCTVTENAAKKCKYEIRKMQRTNPRAFIVVMGCYSQISPDEIADIQGVDVILSQREKFFITRYLGNMKKKTVPDLYSCEIQSITKFFPAYSIGDRTRSFLKIQDGCDYNCSYCIVPLARGVSRSGTVKDTVKQAEEVAEKGIKEVVLTGVNIGDFGKNTRENFFDVIKALEQVSGIERYRISSIEPDLLTNEIIEFVAGSKKYVNHLHLPLQSGSNKILKLMQRRYTKEIFEEKIHAIKGFIPDCGIGVDVICGFPGETENDFRETYEFLEWLDISYLHVFPFSERKMTRAAEFPGKVPVETRNQWSKELQNLSNRKQEYFYQLYMGKAFHVLFEAARQNDSMFGFTGNYIRIEHPYNEELVNTVQKVKLKSHNKQNNTILCEVV